MNIEEIKQTLQSPAYDFLRTEPHLGSNIILLGLGGSHAYGTSTPESDLDIRGIALNTKNEILTGHCFEQVEDKPTDTTIYSFNKIIQLLTNCNPNVIEILGLKPEHYLYLSPIGQELIDNSHLFLSKKAAVSFGGYASQQLRRLDNKAVRTVEQEAREKHILNSIMNAYNSFPDRYTEFNTNGGYINLYIDASQQPEYDTEIFMDINLTHYPLRDYKGMWAEMHNIVKDYSKFGKRNAHAVSHGKLSKHMMHLIRLYLMCFDILEKGEINTYREKELDWLMEIRNGKYLDENNQPVPEFFEIVDGLEARMKMDLRFTKLPDKPDYTKINDFVINVNERIVRGEI